MVPNHAEVEARLIEIARTEAREHRRAHGRAYEPPSDICRLAHVLALIKDKGLCGAVSDDELRAFSAAYWSERIGAAEFLERQTPLF